MLPTPFPILFSNMDFLQQFLGGSGLADGEFGMKALTLSLASAFIFSQVLALTYARTHAGLSYSKTFTQALVLVSMVATMVMFVIGNSLVTAFGLLGALAIIRFRNNLKDTRDTVFIFFSLVLGMAVGGQRVPEGALATLLFCATVWFLHLTNFGARSGFDGHLRCRLIPEAEGFLSQILEAHCLRTHRISTSHSAEAVEIVFEVSLRDHEGGQAFLSQIRAAEGVEDAGLVLRDALQEA